MIWIVYVSLYTKDRLNITSSHSYRSVSSKIIQQKIVVVNSPFIYYIANRMNECKTNDSQMYKRRYYHFIPNSIVFALWQFVWFIRYFVGVVVSLYVFCWTMRF